MSVIKYTKEEVFEALEGALKNTRIKNALLQHDEEMKRDIFVYTKNKTSLELVNTLIEYCYWYAYISNTVAYNLQYQQNEEICFEDVTLSEREGVSEVEKIKQDARRTSSVNYNMYTNNGNSFYPEQYLKYWQIIVDTYKQIESLNEKDFLVFEAPLNYPCVMHEDKAKENIKIENLGAFHLIENEEDFNEKLAYYKNPKISHYYEIVSFAIKANS
ncbi:hypothetical protein WAF17_02735 [Bernardetia sp. ABR2-2B]|uniref:hypothetical protein n=1 Tax=Bernardetia sp. ABR2-2B TaxID=3127472 RepID=UPI0030CE8EB6